MGDFFGGSNSLEMKRRQALTPLRLSFSLAVLTKAVLSTSHLSLSFLDTTDLADPWGKIYAKGSTVKHLTQYSPPPENYTAGATVFGAFEAKKNFRMAC